MSARGYRRSAAAVPSVRAACPEPRSCCWSTWHRPRPAGRTSSSSCRTTTATRRSVATAATSTRRRTSIASPTRACGFDRCFVTNSICGPSRAVILTGKYSHLNGFVRNGNTFDGTQQTVAEAAAAGRLPDRR